MATATWRRKATVIRPIRQAMGPPRIPEARSNSTSTPSSSPSSRSRRASGGVSDDQSTIVTVPDRRGGSAVRLMVIGIAVARLMLRVIINNESVALG